MSDYFLTGCSDFLAPPLAAYQRHADDKTKTSSCSTHTQKWGVCEEGQTHTADAVSDRVIRVAVIELIKTQNGLPG